MTGLLNSLSENLVNVKKNYPWLNLKKVLRKCCKNVWIAVIIIINIIIIIIFITIIIIIFEPSTHCSFTCLNSAIETLKQGVKSA